MPTQEVSLPTCPPHTLSALRRGLQLHSKVRARYRGTSLWMRLHCSLLRACLRLARGIGSLLLALFLDNAVRFLAFPLPFPLAYVAISAVTLAFPLTLPVLMELLAGTMLAWLSHDRLS